jgi:hypothetical protein
MSGADIQREVDAALREVARDVGDGEYLVTLVEPATLPQNPWDVQTGAPVTYSVPAMVSSYPASMIDGTLIQATDKRVLLSARGPTPEVDWRIVIDGVSHAIMMLKPLQPSGVPLYWEAQARA